jgi:hypothetical protein
MGKATFLSIISFLFIFVSSIELRISDCQNVSYFVLGILNFDGDLDDTLISPECLVESRATLNNVRVLLVTGMRWR